MAEETERKPVDIWTERLEQRHLPLPERWLASRDGALTPNDLPSRPEELAAWYRACSAEPGRLDCLVSVYETPAGIAGLRSSGQADAAGLYLLLGELNYNLLRTATCATLRMLDRAFLELGFARVTVRVYAQHIWYADVLQQMGFIRGPEQDGVLSLSAEKAAYLSRKYLF